MIESWGDVLTYSQAADFEKAVILELRLLEKYCIENRLREPLFIEYVNGKRLYVYPPELAVEGACLFVENSDRHNGRALAEPVSMNLQWVVNFFRLTPKLLLDLKRKVGARVSGGEQLMSS